MMKNNQLAHILLVTSELHIAGGLERMVVNLANEFSHSNTNVSLLIIGNTAQSFYPLENNIYTDLLSANFGIGDSEGYIYRKIEFLRDLKNFKKKVDQIGPTILITCEYHFTVASVLSGLYKEIKIVAWQHSSFYQRKSFVWRKALSFALNKVCRIVCLNDSENLLYAKYRARKVVIPNFSQFSHSKSRLSGKRLLTVARLVENKGIDLLIETAEKTLSKHPDWTWQVVGEGPLKSQIEAFQNIKGFARKLELITPHSEKIDEIYSDCSIFILTSRIEPFGMVLIEAMGKGIPCIAFDCETGPRHIITNGEDGFLIEKENPKKMAEAISNLINDEDKRQKMGAAAFENVQRFSANAVMKKWLQLVEELSFNSQ